jgi:hypothetical protein
MKWLIISATLAVLVPMAGALSCYYESVGSGNVSSNVPYYAQEQTYYCAAACVQMVAKWSGTSVSQDEAFVFMNGDPGAFGTSGGVRPDDYVRGVRAYTSEGDAYWDRAFFDSALCGFLARPGGLEQQSHVPLGRRHLPRSGPRRWNSVHRRRVVSYEL